MEKHATQQITQPLTVALLGNPNCGKSSVFNQLTGLRQKVGNFPGVTVDKKLGLIRLPDERTIQLIDFPGTYSFYPTSIDERIVVQSLANPSDENYPDAAVYIADVTKLEKHLLLLTQLRDLGLPVILALNMADVAEKEGVDVDEYALSRQLEVPVVKLSGRTGFGIEALKYELQRLIEGGAHQAPALFYEPSPKERQLAEAVRAIVPGANLYQSLLVAHHYTWLPFLSEAQRKLVADLVASHGFETLRSQVNETMQRYDKFTPLVRQSIHNAGSATHPVTEKLDALLTHRVGGPIIFFVLMLLIFQAIFSWAAYPMDLIEQFFTLSGEWAGRHLPAGWFTDLLTEGIIAGLGGILVFIPQIAILFFLVSLLEEVGYMARAAYLFDRLMQAFGLNGRSIVALISGGACAIPAIMSTRTISNWKERLITIMVTPLISCSARIPVYTVLIGFVVPSRIVAGFFNLQGLAFMGLYLLGIMAALLSALVFKMILRTSERSYLMLELPEYRTPVMRNVLLTVWEKVRAFIWEAGRIILAISVALWLLASYGPPAAMQEAEQEALGLARDRHLDETETANLVAARQIEASFAGQLGKAIEPAIRPLGFDWKIGIALITSFAAREVFVGTMATIYSIGSVEDEYTVRDKMAQERDPVTGERIYSLATSLSLLIFYVFAMQCMSTLAVVKRETKSWKWPMIQFSYMSGLAYLGSLLVYQLLS
ncbi:MAG: ferrous iron transport protein B [Lewinellaceae bacterium]|nr:ferrous iron transport protein B [Phaeodactylibacter sp.]MCB9039635.1 ferrous iron transport protein B [Lewinellaceae bacterium]